MTIIIIFNNNNNNNNNNNDDSSVFVRIVLLFSTLGLNLTGRFTIYRLFFLGSL